MNVLIFVTTILILLTILTYGRLETFRINQGYEQLFKHYMEDSERGFTNLAAERKYATTTASKKSGQQKKAKVVATPRVSIITLVDAKEREVHQNEAGKLTIMLKKLMTNLYGQQPFYKQIEQKRPNFINEIISQIEAVTRSLSEEKKIKNAAELANLNLGDEELNEVFYKMLHGAPEVEVNPTEPKPAKSLLPPQETPTEAESEDDKAGQDLAEVEAQEYKSPKGYYSLLDYITANKSFKVRIYLAPKEVLKVIFNDDAVVDEIIKARRDIYKSIKGDKSVDVNAAGDVFKRNFDGRRDPNFDETVLDYKVSKTDPKKYE